MESIVILINARHFFIETDISAMLNQKSTQRFANTMEVDNTGTTHMDGFYTSRKRLKLTDFGITNQTDILDAVGNSTFIYRIESRDISSIGGNNYFTAYVVFYIVGFAESYQF